MTELERLVDATRMAFEEVCRGARHSAPATNPELRVEVVEAAMVEGIATLILIAPWTLSGLIFPEAGRTVTELVVGRRHHPVLADNLEAIGDFLSVNLVADVSGLADRAAAHHAAAALAEPFRQAVARAFREQTVADPMRRDLFKRIGGSRS